MACRPTRHCSPCSRSSRAASSLTNSPSCRPRTSSGSPSASPSPSPAWPCTRFTAPRPNSNPKPDPNPNQVDTEDKGQGLPTVSPPGTGEYGSDQERRGGEAYGTMQADETALTPGRSSLSRSSISGSSTERSSLISATSYGSPSSLGSPGSQL
eukprot:scaffold4575_cov55-Phaeocystis_antarctica.AAC.4